MKKITIGKYTLESLTTGMYTNPLILYREYIQNSTDSIDEAIKQGLLDSNTAKISIYVNSEEREISIEDNGMGIDKNNAYKILTDIGNSQKRSTRNKGFRGIGRLSGLSYCDQLIFETSMYGENKKTIIVFDSGKLSEFLTPGKYDGYGIEDVIQNITDVKYSEEEDNKHYFRVKLKRVNSKLNLLDIDKVKSYLQEVAPVPFDNTKFRFANEINLQLLNCCDSLDQYNIFIEYKDRIEKIYKPYRRRIYVDIKKKLNDEITDVEIKLIKDDINDKNIALVWYGKSQLLGSLVDDSAKGLRVRKSGILIGDRFLANQIFKEDRFNGWIIGEIIVLDNDIIPNARRDDFEKNDSYLFLLKELKKVGNKISNDIREASKKRNTKKVINKENIKESVRSHNVLDTNMDILKKLDEVIISMNKRKNTIEYIEKILIKNNVERKIVDDIIEEIMIL